MKDVRIEDVKPGDVVTDLYFTSNAEKRDEVYLCVSNVIDNSFATKVYKTTFISPSGIHVDRFGCKYMVRVLA